ncbi:MAG: hypothetical protein L6Q98_19650 [Anaerolineae bacterium]|nr:hypothetical protein [Anaerolineae bacterium]NUQ07226.1 hypothetical protein [Anaerolineae bacterium]
MPGQSPFADDWRECLRAHYQYVVRANDRRTLDSLTGVLHQVGFREDELGELYLRATLHVDEVAEDFTPDMTVVAAMVSAAGGAPSEDASAALIAAAEAAAQAVENPSEPDYAAPDAEPAADSAPGDAPSDETPPYDPSGPQQLSLF